VEGHAGLELGDGQSLDELIQDHRVEHSEGEREESEHETHRDEGVDQPQVGHHQNDLRCRQSVLLHLFLLLSTSNAEL
jgi:hypothetical protein